MKFVEMIKKSPITITLLITNVILFVLFNYVFDIELVTLDVERVLIYNEFYRLITAFFINIGWENQLTQSISLFAVGISIEANKYMKKWKFIVNYMVFGILGSLFVLYVGQLANGKLLFFQPTHYALGYTAPLYGLSAMMLYSYAKKEVKSRIDFILVLGALVVPWIEDIFGWIFIDWNLTSVYNALFAAIIGILFSMIKYGFNHIKIKNKVHNIDSLLEKVKNLPAAPIMEMKNAKEYYRFDPRQITKQQRKILRDLTVGSKELLHSKKPIPGEGTTWIIAGRMAIKVQMWTEAYTLIDAAHSLEPKNPRILNTLGWIRTVFKKKDVAEFYYRRGIEEDPDYYLLWNNLGHLLYQNNRKEEAIEAYSKAIELNPNSFYTWLNLGISKIEEGNLGIGKLDEKKIDEAENSVRKALQIFPEYPDAWFFLGEILQMRNNHPKAKKAYQNSLEFAIENWWLEEQAKAIVDYYCLFDP